MFKKIYFLAIITVLFSALSAFAQGEYEPADSSNLTSASLPTGALRVFPNHVPAEINQTLEKLVSGSNGKLRQGDTEVLLWTGGNYQKVGQRTIINRLTDTLKVGGWKYEVGGTENGVTFFTLLKDGANRRAVIGFYGEADGTLVFAWTELQVNDGEPINSNKTTYTESGSVSDYSFTTPAGWSRQNSANEIVLTKDGESRISFLPLMNSSGNLEQDADRILWQVLKGYNSWFGNGFEADYGTFEKGRTAQGLEYFRAYRYAKKAYEVNDGFAQTRFDAIILLVKLGSKVAVIVGRQPFQTMDSKGSTLDAINLVLYDLEFKSVTNSYNLKNELLGSWSAAGGSVALAYTFNPNGSFHKGAAHEFRVRHDAERDKVKQTSYGMTETYSLSNNILTQNYKRTGEVVKYKIRIYYTKYDKDAWQHKIGFLPLDRNDGDTIVLRRSN
jgi:hypothetical protein